MESYKYRVYVNSKGFKKVKPKPDEKPQFEDFDLKYGSNTLRIESPTDDHLSTEPQRATVGALITKWFNDRRFGMVESKGRINVEPGSYTDSGKTVRTLTITAPTDGKLSDDAVHDAVGEIMAWLESTGKPAEKPAAASKPAAATAAAATAAAAAPAKEAPAAKPNDKKDPPKDTTPADGGAAAPAKEAPAAKPDDKKEPPKDDKSGAAAATAAAPAKEAPAAKPSDLDSIGWDFNLTVGQNLDRYGL